MNIIRIVFEKGLGIYRTNNGEWLISTVHGEDFNITPNEVVQKYGVRPVLITDRISLGHERTFLLPIKGNRILDLEHSDLIQIAQSKDMPTQFHTFNLSYVVGALCHHCKRLAEIYNEICHEFAKFPFLDLHEDLDRTTYGNASEPYYELDALLTATLRSYDTTRYIIWNAFGKKDSVPNSFKRTIEKCKNVPPELLARLNHSWDQYGKKLKEYRDCIHHYVPINFWTPTAQMVRLDDRVWSIFIMIPDNPDARSQKHFKYDLNIDALTYGWELTNEILEIAQTIVNEVPNMSNLK